MAKQDEGIRDNGVGRKRGRPAIEDPRDNVYRIRLNDEENERLLKISKEFGMNRPDTIRTLLENYEKSMKED